MLAASATLILCAFWFTLVAHVHGAAASFESFEQKREVVLNDGSSYKTGYIAGLKLDWRASGVLKQGACTYAVHKISNCYTYSLSSNPIKNLDKPKGQQIIFFSTPVLTLPTSNKTTTYTYTWKNYIESTATSTGAAYYQMTIVVSQGYDDMYGDGSSTTRLESQGAAQGQTGIYNEESGVLGVSTSWAKYRGKTTTHVLKLTSVKGKVNAYDYKITDASTGATLISNKDGSGTYALGDVSILMGIRRNPVAAGQSEFKAHFGDFSVVKV